MMSKRVSRRKMRKDKRGIVGIGTLIVFIAMVLVAAIAAAVIINTAAQLQQSAQRTTSDTIHDLGIGVQIVNIVAHVDNSSHKVDNLFIYFELNPGTESLNLSTVLVFVQTRGTGTDKVANLRWADSPNATSPDGSHYYVYDEGASAMGMVMGGLDPNNGYQGINNRPIIDQDALLVARVVLGTPGVGSTMPQGSEGTIKFMPAGGGAIGLSEFRIPGSLDSYEWISL